MSIREIFHYLHGTVPMLFWPALWVQWPRVARALAKHEANGDDVEIFLTGACRIELKIRLAPQTPEESIIHMMRTEHVRFPVMTLVQMNAFAGMNVEHSKNAKKPVQMQLLAGLAPTYAGCVRKMASTSTNVSRAPPLRRHGPKDPIPIAKPLNLEPVCIHRGSPERVSWFRAKRANRKQNRKTNHPLRDAKPGTLCRVRRFGWTRNHAARFGRRTDPRLTHQRFRTDNRSSSPPLNAEASYLANRAAVCAGLKTGVALGNIPSG